MVVVQDRLREGWHVDARVALSRDVQRARIQLRERGVEGDECSEIVPRRRSVVVAQTSRRIAVREADTAGRLEPQHIGLVVPRERVVVKRRRRGSNRFDDVVRAVLVHHT